MVVQSQPVKKIIQVRYLAATTVPAAFFYCDSALVQKFAYFMTSKQDSIITKEIYLSPGQVLKYSIGLENRRVVVKSFIVPSTSDTLKFEVDADNNLRIKGGINFFLEDVIDILYADPRLYKQISNAFLDSLNGPETIRSIRKSNNAAIEDGFNKALYSKSEYDILSIIAKTDYYTRLLLWAKKNEKYAEIETDMNRLFEEKELIQSVNSDAVSKIFSQYVGYVIYRDQLDPQNVNSMVDAIINLGWNKNITAGLFANALEDINMETAVAKKCYEKLQRYLNGEFENQLAKIARTILPSLVNTDKSLLVTAEGRQLTFKELLTNNTSKFLLIDFWASWCAPCRKEAPFFEAAKSDFLDKNIVFVSISIDDDDKINDWKKALKEDGSLKASNQYKLIMPKKSSILENFGLTQIPRYILINSKGEFIHPNFYMPSDPTFKEKLSQIIISGK